MDDCKRVGKGREGIWSKRVVGKVREWGLSWGGGAGNKFFLCVSLYVGKNSYFCKLAGLSAD